ncbi:GNAT family N-acetyltransferase [Paraglaciecola sp.]|uniref:GNAT family N-acetyltransferase n=1 Tax=Paraglaciecola sp. TaxID=1920173 RepID=UPI003EF53E5F
MSDIKIRAAVEADLPTLKGFEQGIISTERPFNDCLKSEHFCYYDLAALIKSDASTVMVAQCNDEIIASGYARIKESKAHLTHDQHIYLGFMFVAQEYRGKGVNQLVVEALITWGKSLGFSDFYLEAYAQNHSATAAYQKLGFEPSLVELKLSL